MKRKNQHSVLHHKLYPAIKRMPCVQVNTHELPEYYWNRNSALVIRFPKTAFPSPAIPVIPASWGNPAWGGNIWITEQGVCTQIRCSLQVDTETYEWKVERFRKGNWQKIELSSQDQEVGKKLIAVREWQQQLCSQVFRTFWTDNQYYKIKGDFLYLVVIYKKKYKAGIGEDLTRNLVRWHAHKWNPTLVWRLNGTGL